MKKLILLLLFAVLGQLGMQAQTALSYGDVVICGWNNNLVSSNRQIQLVLLKDCTAGTVFKIGATGFNNSSTANSASNARATSGISKWTNSTGATLSKGTVITISNNGTVISSDIGIMSNVTSACACGANGSPVVQSTAGGRFFIYYSSASDGTGAGQDLSATSTTATLLGAPISLFGFQGTQSGYTAFLTSGTTGNFKTYLPSDLAAYNLFLDNNAIGGYFTPSRSSFSSVAALRAALLTPTNWSTVSGTATVTFPTGNFTLAPSFTAPTITSFVPVNAKPGDVVTITGTDFNATPSNNIVFFGATKATVTAATATSLTVTVPSGATYSPITLLNTESTLACYSLKNFNPIYSPAKSNLTATDFAPKVDFVTGTASVSVAIGDLDGDGKPDLAVVNQVSNTVSVFRNTATSGSVSTGSFATKVDFTTGSSPQSVAIGDLDGDGKPDLAVANNSSNTVSIFRNTATNGTITTSSFATKVDFTTGSSPYSVAIGDLDLDGKLDLAIVNQGNASVSVLRNTATSGSIGLASFATKVDFTTGPGPFQVAIGDIDADGKLDLVVANAGGSTTVSVFRNTATSGAISASSFDTKVDFSTGSQSFSVAIGDLDGDGKFDLAVANGNNTVSLFRNTATSGAITAASFATKVDFTTGSSPRSIAIGDLDGDGKLDMAVANNAGASVSVLRNTATSGAIATSSFASKVDFATGGTSMYVAIGDLDGDGKPDLATVNYGASTASVLRNTSNNANLSSLTTTAGAISPAFETGTTAYNATVTNATTNTTVTPTVADATATVQVQVNNGSYTAVVNGTASSALALNEGSNTISIKVTAENGDVKTYILTVCRTIVPTFTAIAPLCYGSTFTLPTTSNNGITGTWLPAINTAATTTYTFTPDAGQCSNTATMTITVNSGVTPTFTQVAAICSGASLSALPTTSNNSITGTWSPALNNTATTTYTFTPTAGQCATTKTMTITVNPNVTPAFTQVAAICSGASLSVLPTTSTNAITGTWSPALNNTATTTYTFTPDAGQCSDTATMTITVNSGVTPTFTQVAAICSGASLSALPTTSNNSITGTWSPALNNIATTTYTFTPAAGQCATSTTLTITVNTTAAPSASNQTLCPGSTVSGLVATGTSVKWYTAASGGSSLVGTTALVAGTYFASQTINGCESLTRKAITVTLGGTSLGTISAISGESNLCGLSTTTFSVNPLAGATNYIWTFPLGISPTSSIGNQVTVAVDSSFENGFLTVEAYGVCGYTANKASLSLSKVFEIGAISGSATSCGVSTTTYSVPAVAGATFNWIMPQGITILSGQGTSLVTVVYDNSFHNGTLLSVQATNNCGVSAIRKLVIYNAQKPRTISGSQQICNATTATYTTPIILGATYNWTPPTNMTIVSGQGTNSIVVNMASGFDTGNLSVTATTACGTSEAYVLPISKTKVPSAISGPKSLCGLVKNTYDTSGTLLESVSGQAVYSVPAVAGAINYTWAVPTGASIVSGQGTNAIVVSFNITTFVNGTITVSADTPCGTSAPTALAVSRTSNAITGLTFVCSLTSTTYSVPSTIGSNFVWSVPSWMTITSGQNTSSIVVAFPNPAYKEAVTLNYVSSCNSNETITLLVGCNEYSKVASNQCGATLTALDANINADYVAGFQAYRFEVTNGATVNTLEANKYNFSLTQMPSSTYGTTYGVRVAVKMGGTWGAYGVSCNVTTPALTATTIPTTAVMPSFCGATLAALDTKIGATPVVLATGYRFEITTGGVTTVYDSATYNFRLAQAVTATYGTTYSIRVAAQINGIYGAYEASCNVTTPALAVNVIPTTALLPAVCGTTVPTLTTKIGTMPIYAATGYRFEITTGGVTTLYNSAAYNFMLSQTGVTVAYSTTYTIRVAALINGVYGNYGAACTVTTPPAPVRLLAKTFAVTAYPNPFDTAFGINLVTLSNDYVTISVYDMMGKLVATYQVPPTEVTNLQIGNNFAKGIYNVIVSQANEMQVIRMIRK